MHVYTFLQGRALMMGAVFFFRLIPQLIHEGCYPHSSVTFYFSYGGIQHVQKQ